MDLNTSESGKVGQHHAERVIHPSPTRAVPKGPMADPSGRTNPLSAAKGEDRVDLSEAMREIGGESDQADPFGEAESLDEDRRERILRKIGEGQYDWPESRITVMKRLARELGLLP